MGIDREKAERWSLGYRIPVIIIGTDGTPKDKWYSFPITVSALNPREKHGPWQQPKGLFLSGPTHPSSRYHDQDYVAVLALVKGRDNKVRRVVDVTKKIRMSYGPAL